MFLAAHLGTLNAAATSGLFRSIHDLVDLNGVGGAPDKELVPPNERAAPPLTLPLSAPSARPREREREQEVYECACAYAHCTVFPPAGTIGDKSIHSRPKRHSAGSCCRS